MKTSERFNIAIKALVQAFLQGTLFKGYCSTCAVGNIISYHKGIKLSSCYDIMLEKDGTEENTKWFDVFGTTRQDQFIYPHKYVNEAKEQIDSTGYTWQELAKIEYVFETNTKIPPDNYTEYTLKEIDKDQFNGLMAVVDVLCEIEGITEVQEYKDMFVKA